MKILSLLISLTTSQFLFAQMVVKDIKSFGARGDGVTNDHEAFRRAADFFNRNGGNGKLIIPAGTYIVGDQKFNRNTIKDPVYNGTDVLGFKNIKNLIIEGSSGAIIKYADGMHFGTFDVRTGSPNNNGNNFFNIPNAAMIWNAISLINCQNIIVRNLELNGNSGSIILGGVYGDVGRQLPHSGIYIENSTSVTIDWVNAHHFALDGIQITNKTGNSDVLDKIIVSNSSFEYNARQGISWVGGNDLTVTNCKFNHTGRGKFVSSPGAGLDIEPEVGPVRNGKFTGCEFIDNFGCGMVADQGQSSDCTFTNCTFWGTTLWSAWINRPAFSFYDCNFYGSIVHGYDAKTDYEATKFFNCLFEDKSYDGKEAYGKFLIETNYKRRMRFENCTMIAHKKGYFWMETNPTYSPEEKYQLINCKIYVAGKLLDKNYFSSVPFLHVEN